MQYNVICTFPRIQGTYVWQIMVYKQARVNGGCSAFAEWDKIIYLTRGVLYCHVAHICSLDFMLTRFIPVYTRSRKGVVLVR